MAIDVEFVVDESSRAQGVRQLSAAAGPAPMEGDTASTVRNVTSVPERRDKQGSRTDVVIQLDTPEELFAVDPRALLTGSRRLDSGIDELVDRFLAMKKIRHHRIVLEVAGECSGELAARLERALRRYCELRIQRAERQSEVIWRSGMRSLVSGSVLFLVGVVLSFEFTRPGADEFWRELLGNGVFLVVAWVGLWYPLDLLFIARQSLKREMRVLAEIRTLPVVVQTATGPTAKSG
jgi:hypothetical protein